MTTRLLVKFGSSAKFDPAETSLTLPERLLVLLPRIKQGMAGVSKVIFILDGVDRTSKTFLQTVLRDFLQFYQAQDSNPDLTKFQFVISASLPPQEVHVENMLSFSECSTQVVLKDLTFEEVDAMISRVASYQAIPCQNGFSRMLFELTSGTASLIQKVCFKLLETAFLQDRAPEFTLKMAEEVIDETFVNGDTDLDVMIRKVEKDNRYIDALTRVLRHGTITSPKHDTDLQALVSLGALCHRKGTYRPRNPIFERLLKDYFTTERLANRFYSQKKYQRAKELFFDAIEKQENAANILDTLARSTQAMSDSTDQPDFTVRLLHIFANSVEGSQVCALFLPDLQNKRITMPAALGLSTDYKENFTMSYDEGVTGLVMQTGRLRVIRDVTDEVECPEFVDRQILNELDVRAMVALPLKANGDVIGVIDLCLKRPYQFSQSQIRMLEVLASQASMALQDRLRRLEDERGILSLNQAISGMESSIGTEAVLQRILRAVRIATGVSKVYIVWGASGSMDWHFTIPLDLSRELLKKPNIQRGEGTAGIVIQTGEEFLSSKTQANENFLPLWPEIAFEYGTPIRSDDAIVGCLILACEKLPILTPSQKSLLRSLKTLASIAIREHLLYDIAEKKNQEVLALNAVAEFINKEKRELEVLHLMAGQCLKVIGDSSLTTCILLLDKVKNKLIVKAAQGSPFGHKYIETSFPTHSRVVLGKALDEQTVQFLRNASETPETHLLYPAANSEMVVPIIFREEVLGVIDILSTETNRFNWQDAGSVRIIANNAAIAIKVNELCNKRLVELEALYRLGTGISTSLNKKNILQTVCTEALNTIGNENRIVSAQILHPEEPKWVLTVIQDTSAQNAYSAMENMELDAVVKRVLSHKEHEVIPSIQDEKQYVARKMGMKSAVLVPIVFDDRAFGLITMESRQWDDFGEDELKLLKGLANQAGVALENVRLNQDLTTAQRRLSDAIESVAIDEALASIIHDIKNVATQISGETQWLRKQAREDTISKRNVESTLKGIDSCVANVVSISDRIRNRAYKLPPELKMTNLRSVIEEARELILVKALRSKIGIRWNEQDFDTSVYIDSGRLVRAFFNIMTNAIDAMPDGGFIDITVKMDHDRVEVSFSDNGAGVEPDMLNRVVRPFISSKRTGYGLGLAITKHIVEIDHKGRLKLDSKHGEGTKVTVILPRTAKQHLTQIGHSLNGHQRVRRVGNARDKKHILVVNDEKGLLQRIKRMLVKENFRVAATELGRRALPLCQRHPFDAIVFDYHLKKDKSPHSTAMDFIPEIRQRFPRIPIVVISASLKSLSSESGQFDHFLEINSSFWDDLLPVISKSLNGTSDLNHNAKRSSMV
jgi:signal transduction histidine kinase